MHEALLGAHSGFRWIVLILLIFAVVNAFKNWRSGVDYRKRDKTLNLMTMASMHLQALIGIALYFYDLFAKNEKVIFSKDTFSNELIRFYTIEHFWAMLLAVILITIGRKKAERSTSETAKHRKILIWFGIALLLILVSIPWPFLRPEAGWF